MVSERLQPPSCFFAGDECSALHFYIFMGRESLLLSLVRTKLSSCAQPAKCGTLERGGLERALWVTAG